MANTSKTDAPFEGPYKTSSAIKTDKSGASHSGMSRARHLARIALQQKQKKVKVNPTMKEGYFKNLDIEDKEREDNPGMRSSRKPATKKELKGNQHKIDKNKNGKIDAHDFKLLRKEAADTCPVCGKEPCECPGGDNHVNEISQQAAQKYKSAAKARAKNNDYYAKYGDPDDDTREVHGKQYDKRMKGIAAADKRLKKEDVGVEEGIQQTLRKYVPGYAKRQLNKKMDDQQYAPGDSIKKTVDKDTNFARYKKVADNMKKEEVELDEATAAQIQKVLGPTKNAQQGIAALKKAFKVDDKQARAMMVRAMENMDEDVEQVAELKRSTLTNYMAKASDARKHKNMPTAKVDNRYSGVAKASRKLDKMNNEEVEQIQELGKSSLASYIKKAVKSSVASRKIAGDFEKMSARAKSKSNKEATSNLADKFKVRSFKRQANIDKAVDRLAK